MIIRFLLLAVIIYIVYVWLKRLAVGTRGASAPNSPQENMVSCAHCGVHLPQSDSVAAGARFYCSEEHRIAGPR
jgi:uncharacterized protein